ncbi:Disease resistance RPS2 -like protein [Gossypium arboreum]|uniref:Disease resistance RPS2-like protein n=1 Tax=Gossypium arboreum TaxID=29729 RepID=A0A0B0PYF2_GOSAR|nr:Disease resistance RPS2 -like protein [Gossypium arboreum]
MCVANSLGKLQTLKIERCFGMEEVIQDSQVLEFSEMTEKKQISNVTVPERRGGTSISNFEELFEYSGYNLSTLKFLHLSKLTELRVIWSGPIQDEHFQNLSRLVVQNCRRLRYIFSPTIARNFPQLLSLDIFDCEELEQIIEKDQIPSQHHLQPICFAKLSCIRIFNCENLKCPFPITLAHGGLPKLSQLYLKRVTKLGQVFEGDESNVSKDEEKVIHLPRLTHLVLHNLPNLVSFSPVGYHFVFPSLTYLQVKGYPNVTTRFSVDSEKSVHAKTQVSQSVDEIIVEESATAQETAWPIGSDIWWRKRKY